MLSKEKPADIMKSKLLILTLTSISSLIMAAEGSKQHRHDPDALAALIIENCDADNNGTLNRDEFKKSRFCQLIVKKRGIDEAHKIFSHSDNNKDGELSQREIARIDQIKTSTQHKRHGKPRKKL